MNNNNVIFLGFADNEVPKFKEVSSKDYILFGEKNDFPDHLLKLYNKSSNHNAIVNGKTTYIIGKGFEINPVVNREGETLNKVFKKYCTDIELFGGGRLQCIWKLGGTIEISHMPFYKLRKDKKGRGFWYHEDWKKCGAREPATFIPNFDPKTPKGVQIFSYDEYRPGIEHYPLPSYFGALNDIETDVEISIYNLSVMKNGQFSGKLVSFFNGKPETEEAKGELEKMWNKKFQGSGNAGMTMLAFNNSTDKAPEVADLSATDLDKLFEQLNKTVQGEIFSGHQVTSPMLFGIKTEGQLGGRSEILEAFEIFKNTYVNDKQMAIEEAYDFLSAYLKLQPQKLIPVEPVSTSLNATDFKDILPQEWVWEKLGIDPAKYPVPAGAAPGVKPGLPGTTPQAQTVNENLKNLTGTQHRQLQRIIREYSKGKMKREVATTLLKSSLALSDEEILTLLGPIGFDADMSEEEFAAMQFESIGQPKSDFTVIKSMKFESMKDEYFADLSQVDSDIVDLIRKDKRVTPEIIAETIKSSTEYINSRIKSLTKSGVLVESKNTIGIDTIIERAIQPETIDFRPKPETVDVFVKYSYEVRPGAGPEVIDTTRPFCRKLIALDRVYTRAEIETVSQRLGYSVFDRAGGWWGASPQCRHQWNRVIIVKKKKA